MESATKMVMDPAEDARAAVDRVAAQLAELGLAVLPAKALEDLAVGAVSMGLGEEEHEVDALGWAFAALFKVSPSHVDRVLIWGLDFEEDLTRKAMGLAALEIVERVRP